MKERLKREIPLTGPISHSMIQSTWLLPPGAFRLSADGGPLIDYPSGFPKVKESDFRGKGPSAVIIDRGDTASTCQHGGGGYTTDETHTIRIGFYQVYLARSHSADWYHYYKTANPIYIATGSKFKMYSTGSRAGGIVGSMNPSGSRGRIGFCDMQHSKIDGTGLNKKCSGHSGNNPGWNLSIYQESNMTDQGTALPSNSSTGGDGDFKGMWLEYNRLTQKNDHFWYWIDTSGIFKVIKNTSGSGGNPPGAIPWNTETPVRTYNGMATPGQSTWTFGLSATVSTRSDGGNSTIASCDAWSAETV
jgi:hypothetical protein